MVQFNSVWQQLHLQVGLQALPLVVMLQVQVSRAEKRPDWGQFTGATGSREEIFTGLEGIFHARAAPQEKLRQSGVRPETRLR